MSTQPGSGVPVRTAFPAACRLVLISILSLYFELTMIRWIPTQVRLLAYFTNFVLIAALLGLGIGMLLAARRPRLLLYFPLGLLALTLAVVLLERNNLVLPIVADDNVVWNYLTSLPVSGVVSYLILAAFFALMVAVFLPLGQEVGLALRPFPPLTAYALNILGSLVGVLGFAVVNRLDVGPELWFTSGSILLGLYVLVTMAHLRHLITVLPLLAVVALVFIDSTAVPAGASVYWSPYYKIRVEPETMAGHRVGYLLAVNSDNFQHAYDLSGRFRGIGNMTGRQRQYDLPFRLTHPKTVLVLGAGMGNDVAAAIRNVQRAQIDAVEIDPVIADLGRRLHPERPYSHANVALHVTDARSYLEQTSKKFDLILFGKLDSHRVFSHMSSVRMDNYIYTRENMQTVRRHLAPGGVVAVGFVVHQKWIADRLFTLLTTVFGHAPLVYQTSNEAYDTLYFNAEKPLAPPAGWPVISHQQFVSQILRGSERRDTWHYASVEGFIRLTEFSTRSALLTDDWPYLYMRSRTVPVNYLIVLILTVLVSVLVVRLTVRRIDFTSLANWNFLLLGAGFALQETKGITDIALLFGSTWITNIIVISSILLVILLATLAVSRWRTVPLRVIYIALFAVLLCNYFLPLRGLLEYSFWVQVCVSGVRVAGPMFFSGIIFARWFENTGAPSAALGANLLGAVVGGLTEYSSLALGLRDLYLVAILFYGLSFIIGFRPVLRGTPIDQRAEAASGRL